MLAALSAALFSRVPPNLDLFEDGHSLAPLQTYLQGGKPYRDTVPAHGWISDGGLHWVAVRFVGESVVAIQRFEAGFRLSFWPAVFLVAVAATRRVGYALVGVFLLFLLFPQSGFSRPIPALLALALAIHAMRSRRKSVWLAAGVAAAAAAMFAVEFGVFASVAGLTAAALSRRRRSANIGLYLAGASFVLLTAVFSAAAEGVLPALVSAHREHLPALLDVYALGLRSVVIPWQADASKIVFLAGLLASAACLGHAVSRWPNLGGAVRSLLPLVVFFLLASLSVVNRHHYVYPLIVLPGLVALGLVALRRGSSVVRAAALAIVGVFVLAAIRPLSVLRSTISRLGSVEIPAGWVRLEAPERVRGVYMRDADARLVQALEVVLGSGVIGSADTWADFVNAPALYYVFGRRPPVRYSDVPFFQPPAARAEVSQAFGSDPGIGVVLVRSGRPAERVDGIDNRLRTPEVWKVISDCFEPAFRESDIEIWRRRPFGCRPQPERRVRESASRPSSR
jgi:hypothetical protein